MERIDIAKLLKDCPSGMELDCTMFDNLYFDDIADDASRCTNYKIRCYTICDNTKLSVVFSKFGTYTLDKSAKCVIFPKGKTTWEGFQRPFKNGDILYIDCNDNKDIFKGLEYIFILKEIKDNKIYCYCYIDQINEYKKFDECFLSDMIYPLRFATKEEKKKLFNIIKKMDTNGIVKVRY